MATLASEPVNPEDPGRIAVLEARLSAMEAAVPLLVAAFTNALESVNGPARSPSRPRTPLYAVPAAGSALEASMQDSITAATLKACGS